MRVAAQCVANFSLPAASLPRWFRVLWVSSEIAAWLLCALAPRWLSAGTPGAWWHFDILEAQPSRPDYMLSDFASAISMTVIFTPDMPQWSHNAPDINRLAVNTLASTPAIWYAQWRLASLGYRSAGRSASPTRDYGGIRRASFIRHYTTNFDFAAALPLAFYHVSFTILVSFITWLQNFLLYSILYRALCQLIFRYRAPHFTILADFILPPLFLIVHYFCTSFTRSMPLR